MKKVSINGINFELRKDSVNVPGSITYDTIFDAYKNPSSTKISIWNEWSYWFAKDDGAIWCVKSHNCFNFSIAGYVSDAGTKDRYYVYITPTHNYAWKVA